MDDAKTFVLGIFQTVRERFGNPLVSAFVVAWAIWNFRLLLVFLGSGDGGWKAKISYIDNHLFPKQLDWLIHGSLIPLGIALTWIYLLPPLLRRIAADHEKNLNRTRDAIFTATEVRTLSSEEALHLRSVMIKQRAEWQTEKAETVQSLENFAKRTEEQAKALELLKKRENELEDEIKKLKAPPPKKPFDFSGKSTEEKAKAIGIQLDLMADPNDALVTFDGKKVKWPWSTNEDAKFNIPLTRFVESPLREETTAATLLIYKLGYLGKKMSFKDWETLLEKHGFNRAAQEVNHLYLVGVLSGSSVEPAFAMNERGIPLWLTQIGFATTISVKPSD